MRGIGKRIEDNCFLVRTFKGQLLTNCSGELAGTIPEPKN